MLLRGWECSKFGVILQGVDFCSISGNFLSALDGSPALFTLIF